jgi:hypothetical protein
MALMRNMPPQEQVEEWLRRIHIDGFSDSHTFTEHTFPFEAFNEVLLEAEPYYYPCKAKLYLHCPMTMKRAMTVLRQLVRPHGYTFMTHERLLSGRKFNEYYLIPEIIQPLEPLKVNAVYFE